MEILRTTDTVKLRLISGIFSAAYRRNFSQALLLHRTLILLQEPLRTMPSVTGTSILDEALVCIGQRIASILIQPADVDKNYVASLHNEVVSIPSAEERRNLVNYGFGPACRCLDCRSSIIKRQLPTCARACQDRFSQLLGH
jgi:hypothetical protein